MFRKLLLGSPENVTRFFNKVVCRPQPVQRLRSPCRSRHLNHPESHGEQTGGHAGTDSPCCLGNDPSDQLDAGPAAAAGAVRPAAGTDSDAAVGTGPGLEHPPQRTNPRALPAITDQRAHRPGTPGQPTTLRAAARVGGDGAAAPGTAASALLSPHALS